MHIAAIITVPDRTRLTGTSPWDIPAIASWHVLGKSVLERVVERLHVFGVSEISVITEEWQTGSSGLESVPHKFWDKWEKTVSRYFQFGLETLLLLRIGPYLELDITEFLRFHRQTRSAMTQVYDQDGALDLVAIDGRSLRNASGSFRSRLRTVIPSHQRYDFDGYSNRLNDVRAYCHLVEDSLSGQAAIRPIGTEIRPNVWCGDGSRIDGSASIVGPVYIGRNSTVTAGCNISRASIEQHSFVDCGTTVQDASILKNTYVGIGLNIQNSLVSQNRLFHLHRNVQIQLRDRRLLGKTSKIRNMFNRPWTATSFQSKKQSLVN